MYDLKKSLNKEKKVDSVKQFFISLNFAQLLLNNKSTTIWVNIFIGFTTHAPPPTVRCRQCERLPVH